MKTDSPRADARWVPVLDAAALATGTLARARVGEHALVLADAGGTLHALAALCPHDHACLAAGALDGDVLVCPRHGARFRLRDGVCGPGFRLPPLPCYPVRRRGGRIEVDAAAVERRPPRLAPRAVWDLTRE